MNDESLVQAHNRVVPVISVVTCTYNSEKYLTKALESVESQTYKNIEHIINDSFSTDRSLEIIHNYIEKNESIYAVNIDGNTFCRRI